MRFLEVRYYRAAGTKAPTLIEDDEEREINEDKQEVAVFLIPNISHLMPSEEEWEKTKKSFMDTYQGLFESSEAEKAEESDVKGGQQAPEDMETIQVSEPALDESQESTHAEPVEGEPTHYSKLDINNMKVGAILL